MKEMAAACCPLKSGRVTCAACGWVVRLRETRDFSFCVMDRKQNAKICAKCELDVPKNRSLDEDVSQKDVIDGGCF